MNEELQCSVNEKHTMNITLTGRPQVTGLCPTPALVHGGGPTWSGLSVKFSRFSHVTVDLIDPRSACDR